MTSLFVNGQASTPSGLKVAPQSYSSLEQVAEQLRQYLPLADGERFRINCVKVLEQTLPQSGYQLRVAETAEIDDCAAFTIPDMGIVVFREDVYDLLHADNVYGRSTVIHELAHIVLRHSVTLHRGASLGHHQFFEDSEWQAKSLTAAIMMPIAACKLSSSAEELASICGTSVQASIYRLQRLVKDGIIQPQMPLWGNL